MSALTNDRTTDRPIHPPARSARAWRESRLVVALAIAWSTMAGAAQRPAFSHEIVVESPATIESTLRRLGREGYACAAVARPEGRMLSHNVAVFVTRPAQGTTAAADTTVVTGTPGDTADFERRVNASAAQGFRLCGVTVTAPLWGKPAAYATVAVMTRAAGSSIGTAYRVVRTRGRREEWAVLEKAAADGFAVSQLVALTESEVSNISDIVFVAERADAARPLLYELAFAGNAVALQKDLDKITARGFRVQATWATSERMTVLLAKPIQGAWETTHEYKVDDPTRLTISSLDRELLGLFRMKQGVMALYDRRGRMLDYSIVEGTLFDAADRVVRTPPEQRRLVEKLDVDGGRGYRPLTVTWRQLGPNAGMAVDVVLSRAGQ